MSKFAKFYKIYLFVFAVIAIGIFTYFFVAYFQKPNFQLECLPIEMEPYADGEHRVDSFNNNENIIAFYGFGMRDQSGQLQPLFKWYTTTDTHVISPCDGVVGQVVKQPESHDYEIHIIPKGITGFFGLPLSYFVSLDHVSDVKVKAGQEVKAGQVIGKVGGDGMNDLGIGFVELDICAFLQKGSNHYAPFMFFNPTKRQMYEDKVTQMLSEMETRYANIETPTKLLYFCNPLIELGGHFNSGADYAGCYGTEISDTIYLDKNSPEYRGNNGIFEVLSAQGFLSIIVGVMVIVLAVIAVMPLIIHKIILKRAR